MMLLLFCSDPWSIRSPDPVYEQEWQAAQKYGFTTVLLHFDEIEQGNFERALRHIALTEQVQEVIYRGWMLPVKLYEQLYQALSDRGYRLINTPAAYQHCHYLPASYPILKDWMPHTVWLPLGLDEAIDFDRVMALLTEFGTQPVILKDYVKSRKHEWYEACYIPDASDREQVERVVTNFRRLQGEALQGGLVFRAYHDLQPLTIHSKSAMPLSKEYRLFFLDTHLLLWNSYWDEGEYDQEELPLLELSKLAHRVQSRFFTMDVALQRDGSWLVVELGDGQVAALPEHTNTQEFYEALYRWSGNDNS